MPQLTIKGIDTKTIKSYYKQIMEIISKVAQVNIKYVKIDLVTSELLGEENSFIKLEMLWLKGRDQQVQDDTAKALTDFFKSKGYEFVQITFNNMEKTDFYENANHY